jgi:phosphoribosylaminoimidazolecarboxamide formyltransferase/IMP cyclohydrolase
VKTVNKVRTALISVSDKTGIVDFARGLEELGIEIISTGGTYKLLTDSGLKVTYISEITGFPEILDGRVKTLHPMIHGGILGRRELTTHREQMEKHGIKPIDLVVVNLYPFEATISREGVTLEEAIENIDIGGPTMIRSAAKNHRDVGVVVDPEMYDVVLSQLRVNDGVLSDDLLFDLSLHAFTHTAQYDAVISNYLFGVQQKGEVAFPDIFLGSFTKSMDLRYGENPHQKAAFYVEKRIDVPCISNAKQLWGKELSFNNINDVNGAFELVKEFNEITVVALKHTNPCGVGSGKTVYEAYIRAYESDPVSIFGGIVACNSVIDADTAREMNKIFLEVIIAPGYTDEALEVFKEKKNIRILQVPELKGNNGKHLDFKRVAGGLLVQEADAIKLDLESLKVVTERKPTKEELKDLLFAWKVVKHVKSNAIVLAKGNATTGIGAGQMNRVGAAEIACKQAGEKAKGSIVASDAYFPFADTVEVCAKAGVTAIIQPGGSIRDDESIQAANKYGIAMVFTGIRHFKH